ncbi:MAG: phosphate ABC transporter substrate-binding protein [Ignavibacteriales bacterium]|nr:MAG: phosphate ABC transporter substrate-binding protein [Ignavibacteriales bacterium]
MNIRSFLYIVLILVLAGCTSSNYEVATIRIKGSDTMLQLTEKLATQYMKGNPSVSIYVDGGGTASGVNSLIKNEVDIATASRSLKAEEAKLLAEYYGSLGMYYLIAKDALSIYINQNNPVKEFTLSELKKIFLCEINNWKELGGEDKMIQTVIRTPNSGTHLYFLEHVLEGSEYCNNSVVLPTTESVIDFIDENENAIGYGGIGYKENMTHAAINGIESSEANARNDRYPITRYLHFFTSKTPTGAIKNFIDWVLSPAGQKVVKDSGFIPLWEISY